MARGRVRRRTTRKSRRRKSLRRTSTAIALLILAAVFIVLLCIFGGRIHRRLFGSGRHNHTVSNTFVDRLQGKPYSTSDYNGIDVSQHQGFIKWEDVAKDKKIQFVYIRATMGKGHPDVRYSQNIKGARNASIPVGSYHFLTSKFSIDEQFRSFTSLVNPDEQDLIPMVDVEEGYVDGWSRVQLQDSLAKFSDLILKHYGAKPMIYSSESFYNNNLAPRFNSHIIYIASYSTMEPVVKGIQSHNLWQYSEKGHIHGIGENVDLCRFTNGTELKDIIMPTTKNKEKD